RNSLFRAISASPEWLSGTARHIDDSELDWLIIVTLIFSSARARNTRAAIPGTPDMPLPSTETRHCPRIAVTALTGCEPGVNRLSTTVPSRSGAKELRERTGIARPAAGIIAL